MRENAFTFQFSFLTVQLLTRVPGCSAGPIHTQVANPNHSHLATPFMSSPSRTAQFTRLHKILKKYYHPVAPDPNRSVLEHLLFACCLENAHYAVAEEAFAALVHTFFDWNEIRVSSVRELSEVMAGLPDPSAAAHRVKRILQNVFEATYAFDLEELRKQNLGPAVERLEKNRGDDQVLRGLRGPVGPGRPLHPDRFRDAGACSCGRSGQPTRTSRRGSSPGWSGRSPRTRGWSSAPCLHQLGADFVASPYTPSVHNLLLEINPQIKDRLPLTARRKIVDPGAVGRLARIGERRQSQESPPGSGGPGAG